MAVENKKENNRIKSISSALTYFKPVNSKTGGLDAKSEALNLNTEPKYIESFIKKVANAPMDSTQKENFLNDVIIKAESLNNNRLNKGLRTRIYNAFSDIYEEGQLQGLTGSILAEPLRQALLASEVGHKLVYTDRDGQRKMDGQVQSKL